MTKLRRNLYVTYGVAVTVLFTVLTSSPHARHACGATPAETRGAGSRAVLQRIHAPRNPLHTALGQLDLQHPANLELAFAPPEFPEHWGEPPAIQTRDYRRLPGGYGFGSTTLANWIQKNLDRDAADAAEDTDAGNNEPAAGKVEVAVERSQPLRVWHTVTLDLDGPAADERDNGPNPFTDYRFTVTFVHESGEPSYSVPGYFAADGRAAESSAEQGTTWRAHLCPDKPGRWDFTIRFVRGHHAALDAEASSEPVRPYDGHMGTLEVAPLDADADSIAARGRLEYVGSHYLRFAGSGEYFLKAGPDAPETLLAYRDFDGTESHNPNAPLKTWQPHIQDWREGDPSWHQGRGKGLIGAVNYLAQKGANSVSFLPYNAGGDGDNVWPFVSRNDKLHYDCSKLDQWRIVFEHASRRGLHLHFKLQENEMDDNRLGAERNVADVPESLDNGSLGPERKLYCRELIARYAHLLALNWNLGEENTQSTEEVRAMARYIHDTDPYDHPIVIHTFPSEQEQVYRPLLGEGSVLTGASLQNSWSDVHRLTLRWRSASAEAGRPWVVANDEQGPASDGVPPDPGYQGHSGEARQGGRTYTLHDIRQATLWGNLMAGGAGVEYYFGYRLPQNDLVCEDFRSRDRSWEYCRIALKFFQEQEIPFWDMENADELIGNPEHNNERYAFARPGNLYLVYLPQGGTCQVDLSEAPGDFTLGWFNPRTGGPLTAGSVTRIQGGATASLGDPPADTDKDWLAVVRASADTP